MKPRISSLGTVSSWPITVHEVGVDVIDDRSNDEMCLRRLQAHDEDALAELYDRHGSLGFTLACRILDDRLQAEEVVQEVFLSIWRNADRYDPNRSNFRSWFLAIVRNRCFDKLRGRAARPRIAYEAEISEHSGSHDVAHEVARSLTAETVRQAMGGLPNEQRETLELAYYQGLSQAEISQRMAVPLGTVKGRVRMAMQKLREALSGLELEGNL